MTLYLSPAWHPVLRTLVQVRVSLRWLFNTKEHSILLLPSKRKTCMASSKLSRGKSLVLVLDLNVCLCMCVHFMQPVDCQRSVLFGVAEEQFVGLYSAETSAGRDKSHLYPHVAGIWFWLCGLRTPFRGWDLLLRTLGILWHTFHFVFLTYVFWKSSILSFVLSPSVQPRLSDPLGRGIMDSFCTIKLGFQGWILSILLVRAVNQWGSKELVESLLAESVWHYEELGAGFSFLKWSALN